MRLCDVIVSSILLLLLAPLMGLIALAVMIETGCPAIFSCHRLGRGGVPFRLLKFRTMYQGAPYTTYDKSERDPRITRVGYWLRQYSLDELPQLWNVLRGDMAIWGPRPWMTCEALHPYAQDILSRKPGLINAYVAFGRSELTHDERLRLDAKFARRMNWRQILHATIRLPARIVDRRGAR